MLEGLDKIDWEALHHFHGPASDVPEIIRRLSDGDTGAIRDLFDDDFPPGYFIDNVTPYIIPFILEILRDGKESFRGALLGTLKRLVDACKFGLSQAAQDEWQVPRFEYAKRCIVTYEELSRGIPLYQHILTNHSEARAKYEAADLLSQFNENGTKIADYFCDRSKNETDDTVIASLLYNLAKLVTTTVELSGDSVSERKKYLTFLYELLEENRSDIVNVGAGLCAVQIGREEVHFFNFVLSSVVIRVLENELLRMVSEREELRVFMVPVYSKEWIASHLAMASADKLADFLRRNENSLDIVNVHLIIRELLDSRLRRLERKEAFFGYEPQDRNIAFWPPIEPLPIEYLYHQFDFRIIDRVSDSKQIEVLRFLAEYDKFWQLPTNLLSFFYDLPDDREELRKLISESKP